MQEELHDEKLMRSWNIPEPLATTSANYDDANMFHMCMDGIGDLGSGTATGPLIVQNPLFGVFDSDTFPQPDVANGNFNTPQKKPFSRADSANYALSNVIGDAKDNFRFSDLPKSGGLVSLTDPFSPSEWSTGVSDVYGCTFSLGSFENFSESSIEPVSVVDGKEDSSDSIVHASNYKPQYHSSDSALDGFPKTSLEPNPESSHDQDIGSAALALSPEDKLFWGWFLANSEHELSEQVGPSLTSLQIKPSQTYSNVEIRPEPQLETKAKKVVSVPKVSRAVPKRFVSKGPVDVMVSAIQCLNVVLDYKGYQGEIQRIIVNNNITNVAYTAHDPETQKKLYSQPISEPFVADCNMEFVGFPTRGQVPQISNVSGILQRKIYIRDISAVVNAVTLILYVELSKFNINLPYEPQIHRYELDNRGAVVNETKCGLCPFCPTVKFLPFKNSSYLSHLTLEHGVYANSFVVPEGLYYGKYAVTRNVDVHKTRTVKAIQCPACFQVVEVSCWKNKANPLLSYFRHFKKKHQNLTKTFMRSNVDPMLYEKQ